MESEKSEKIDGRKNNGSTKGSNNGGGRKASIEKIRDEIRKQTIAEFWVNLAETEAIPRLTQMLDSPFGDVAWKAIKEVMDRAYGKPKESVDLTSKGKRIGGFNYVAPNARDNPNN